MVRSEQSGLGAAEAFYFEIIIVLNALFRWGWGAAQEIEEDTRFSYIVKCLVQRRGFIKREIL